MALGTNFSFSCVAIDSKVSMPEIHFWMSARIRQKRMPSKSEFHIRHFILDAKCVNMQRHRDAYATKNHCFCISVSCWHQLWSNFDSLALSFHWCGTTKGEGHYSSTVFVQRWQYACILSVTFALFLARLMQRKKTIVCKKSLVNAHFCRRRRNLIEAKKRALLEKINLCLSTSNKNIFTNHNMYSETYDNHVLLYLLISFIAPLCWHKCII